MSDYVVGRHRGECVLVFRDEKGKRHRHSLGTGDESEAKRRAPSVYQLLTKPRSTAIAELWEAYRRDKKGRAVLRAMKYSWPPMAARFGSMPAEDITIEDCRAHTAERRGRGISDGTIHTELGHLRMVLRWAEKHRLIAKAPAIEKPPKPRPREAHLTREQVRALIDAATLAHIKTYITLAIGTAARNTALLELTWDRVDFDRNLIDLRNPEITRPHKGRAIVPMNTMVRRTLEAVRPVTPEGYVISWKNKKVRSVKRSLGTAARSVQLNDVHPHMLRHSAAVHMAERGVPMEEIAQFLGHSDVNVTRRIYARFSPTYLQSAAKALEY